jgi:hypothetical protein
MTDWNELASRCEAAKGLDRGIDDAIWWPLSVAIGKYRVNAFGEREYNVSYGDHPPDWRALGPYNEAGPYTRSLDAIVALIEREAAGWAWTVYSKALGPHPIPRAVLVSQDFKNQIGCNASTPSLALCAAFCRAMAEKSA